MQSSRWEIAEIAETRLQRSRRWRTRKRKREAEHVSGKGGKAEAGGRGAGSLPKSVFEVQLAEGSQRWRGRLRWRGGRLRWSGRLRWRQGAGTASLRSPNKGIVSCEYGE
jgi:hypothetical protein